MELFAQTLGVGPGGKITFYKYSPQRECYVGFDQAWLMTEASDEQLFRELKDAAPNKSYHLDGKYAGYFLQYKVMKQMVRRTKQYPAPFSSIPFGRVKIDNEENPNTKKSQHEMLFDLSKNHNALTYYACPSVFDKADLYQANVDLSKLHLVEVASSASAFKDNKKHHIFFEFPTMEPTWQSEPVKGKLATPKEVAQSVADRLAEFNTSAAENLLNLLETLRGSVREGAYGDLEAGNRISDALQSLTIVKFSKADA